ncbi:nuclear transport factor 2 family protein [Paludisphaera rhizosphaerae]|uniref:nuclear transport factor 2 family protein n=1 Tax=Paludisphaera rhizosphaerae TaxID=2711216 RepID=UPI00197E43F7|nr:nuclear transport factor 2 family protein [Paludisphaera rhizosphaerae]
MHPNVQLIERLYSALCDGNPDAAALCYAHDAHFQDIAFSLDGRESIRQMWRLVSSRKVQVTFDSLTADDRQGAGHWVADYTFSDTGRPVVNDIRSRFAFREGLIVDHRDECDAWSWANQAYPFPKNLLVGLIGPLRRFGARKKLEEFIRENPETFT